MARGSPEAALLTSCLSIASPLVICLRCPFSVTTTSSLSACCKSVNEVLDPRGRPLGLPERPFLKRVRRGGLPKPTAYFALSLAGMTFLRLDFSLALVEKLTARRVTGTFAGKGLPAAHDCIDVERIKFEPVAPPPHALRCDYRRAAAEECIKHHLAARCAVHDGVGHQRDRLHCWMQREQVALFSVARKRIHSWVVPDVAAVAAILAELDIVSMPLPAIFKNKDQLVLAAIKGAHAGAVLGPYADVFQFPISLAASRQHLAHVPPIHAYEMERAIDAVAGEERAGAAEECRKLLLAHLARGHYELTMLNRAQAAQVAVDRDVIGRIAKRRRRLLAVHQCHVRGFIESAAAIDAVVAEQPEIAAAAYGWPQRGDGNYIGVIVGFRRGRQPLDSQINRWFRG